MMSPRFEEKWVGVGGGGVGKRGTLRGSKKSFFH